ncbi:cytochrome d ubiquinol oxidase subunit II [Propionibacterium cyclohexanicum]|uniref:Cytochrome d ubiquinol oxidase subunit II n=1 Tax=Propionibacterium cyclohexanicum TaxID=64702 RepID=A0A1H9T341_9ACTN|nr:cytochrome d ubiquinol oxidase subunit II [Propionibacterium cyclohexanicum]SER91477.1 cytochrome d ubiquinol oxidase subunit II [Propionibacterium cyclohexanicum]
MFTDIALTSLQTATLGATPLQVVWFLLIAVLWCGFFFLEGFDFGVAMLYPVLGRDPKRRRVLINSIGATWDGNEVWLITAGGAMFAAFPGWYSTLFSALYLPLFLVLVGLILRGISFEYRAKHPSTRWRDTFDTIGTVGSFIVTLVLGIGFANFVRGLPVAPDTSAAYGDPNLFTGGFWSLFNFYGLLGGVTFVLLFITHGAMFLGIKTYGEVHDDAMSLLKKLGPVTVVVVAAFVLLGNIVYPASENPYAGTLASVLMWLTGLLAIAAVAFGVLAQLRGRNVLAFSGTGLSVIAMVAMIFVKIYGTLGFVSADPNRPLNMVTASSSPMTLQLMTVFAVIMVPIVLAYQVWSYWVLRKRLSVKDLPQQPIEENVVEVQA